MARTRRTIQPHAALLVIAIAYAAVAQGAFFGPQLLIFQFLIGAATLAAGISIHPSRADFADASTIATACVIIPLLLSGLFAGQLGLALPQLAFLISLLAVVFCARRLVEHDRRSVIGALLLVAAVIGLLGWFGVAFRSAPSALVNGALWRASTTITYANGAACLLAMCALIALAYLKSARATGVALLCSYVLLVGLASTFSRGGVFGFLVGLSVLAARCGVRSFARSVWPPVVGAAVAIVALIPSVPASSHAHPWIAVGGLLVGAAIAGEGHRVGLGQALAIAGGALVVIVILGPIALHIGFAELGAARIGRDISVVDREARWSEFLQIGRTHIFFGAGPGAFLLRYFRTTDASLAVSRFAHNEYLQIFAEQGIVGLLGLSTALATLGRATLRGGRTDWLASGARAALCVFLVQGLTDFVWNIPIIPVVAAILWVVATSPPADGDGSLLDARRRDSWREVAAS